MASDIDFCTSLQVFHNETIWILVNWWLCGDIEHARENSVALPHKLIQTDLVQWIPATFILDVAFIFHITNILDGDYLHTEGVKYAYFCRFK